MTKRTYAILMGMIAGCFLTAATCSATARELTAEDALYLIEMELSTNDASTEKGSEIRLRMEWQRQQEKIRTWIRQTRDPYGLKDMSVRELKQLSDGLELAIAHCKDRDDLNTLVRFYEAVLNKARQRSGWSIKSLDRESRE